MVNSIVCRRTISRLDRFYQRLSAQIYFPPTLGENPAVLLCGRELPAAEVLSRNTNEGRVMLRRYNYVLLLAEGSDERLLNPGLAMPWAREG